MRINAAQAGRAMKKSEGKSPALLHLLQRCKKNGDPWENRTPVYGVRGRRLARLTNGPRKKKRAGTYLFSQVVSNQVSSAQQSLTTVFGMGTGGTSASSAPAMDAGIHFSLLRFSARRHAARFIAPSKLNKELRANGRT